MTEQAKVPAIRFAGFTDPWEQRKLGELFFESNERSSSMEILSVSVAKGIYPASESDRDTNPGASLVNYKVVHKGDVVYNSMRMWQGAVGSSDYDGIVSPAYVVARPTIELDSTCFGYLLKRPEMLYKYLCDSQGNSKDTQTLKYDRFADIEATMPANLEEQRAISACLESVDHLITLHQRKYDKLVVFKKSMLEKMFPKDGESVPEIRFAGFTDPWEQRKLGELVVIERGGSPRPIDEYITDDTNGLNWVKIGDAPSLGRYISKTSEKIKPEGLSKTRQVHPGDLILSNSMSFGRPYIMAIEGCIHDGWLLIRDEPKSFDPMYLCHMLGTPKMLNQYRMLASGSTVNNLNKELVSNASILMPCKSEQKVIGQFFNHLDDLITLHQRKLELLRNIKKSLLDKMFV